MILYTEHPVGYFTPISAEEVTPEQMYSYIDTLEERKRVYPNFEYNDILEGGIVKRDVPLSDFMDKRVYAVVFTDKKLIVGIWDTESGLRDYIRGESYIEDDLYQQYVDKLSQQ